MKVQPFCRHKTERANNHIKQANAFFFARNSVGVTYKQLTAMLTDAIHTFSHIASFGMFKGRIIGRRSVGTNSAPAREFTLC
jgi:hypothetical protein